MRASAVIRGWMRVRNGALPLATAWMLPPLLTVAVAAAPLRPLAVAAAGCSRCSLSGAK